MPAFDTRTSELAELIARGSFAHLEKAKRPLNETDVAMFANRITATLQRSAKYKKAYGDKKYNQYAPEGTCDFTKIRNSCIALFNMRATRINSRWVWTVDGQNPLDAIVTEVSADSLLAGCVNLSVSQFSTSFMLAGKTGSAKSSIMFQLLHALHRVGRCKYLRVVNLGTWRGLEEMTANSGLDKGCHASINKAQPGAAEKLADWLVTCVHAAQRGIDLEGETFSLGVTIIDAGELLATKCVREALAYVNENKRHLMMTLIADSQYNSVLADCKDYFENVLHAGRSTVLEGNFSPTKEFLNGTDYQVTQTPCMTHRLRY
jgi:hypothetical protein